MNRMATPGLPCLAALLLGVAGLSAPGCESEEAGPALRVTEPRFDFGVVSEGQVLEHEWRLTVRAPVRVREAKSDCGCTLARLELERRGAASTYDLGTPLVPGDVLRVNARYDTVGRSGPSTRSIQLALSEGLLTLALAADVRPWLRQEPALLTFTRAREGEGSECTFRVTSLTGEAFGLSATRRALPPWVTVALAPETEPGAVPARAASWHVLAKLAPEAPRGTYNYALELETDVPIPGPAGSGASPRHHALAPLWPVQVVGPVALSRPSLEFGVVDARETVAQSVRLEGFDAAFRPAAVQARLAPLRPQDPFPLGRTAQVHVRPGPEACDIEVVLAGLDREVTGTFLARLVVETGHPGLPELEAIVRGTCSPSEGRP